MRFPLAKDSLWFLVPLIFVSALLFLVGFKVAGWFSVGLIIFVAYFFRDPVRRPPEGEDLIVAPADGKIVKVDTAYASADHDEGSVCISTFLSVFNVHIQRAPVAGTVTRKFYNKGKFMAAWDHKASLDNEQALTVFKTDIGPVGVKQIAGFVARRIITWVNVGSSLERSQRLGLIRFGSRVDLIMPPDVTVIVKVGDHVKGGETVMARAKKG